MVALRHYAEQRFTCAQCGRCCRRGWDIAVTAAEVEGYRKAGAAAWYTTEEVAERTGTETETGTALRVNTLRKRNGSGIRVRYTG